jgi:hypothetical protein
MKRRNTLALAALMLPIPLAAMGQTGVSDDRVSLPEGPGSLEGVGESVRPNLNMGTMSWNVPIPVPQGFPGVTPELGLRYDSGAGSGAVGIGWSMDVPAIERLTLRGLPDYDLDDEFTAEGGQLVRVSQNPLVYRARDERGFVRYTWMDAGDGAAGYWLAEYPDGRKGYFGATHEGRAVATARHEDAGRTFRYALVDMVDVFGHRLHYTYQRDNAAPGQVGASLLLAVDWVYAQGDAGESTYQVAFAYEPASDPHGAVRRLRRQGRLRRPHGVAPARGLRLLPRSAHPAHAPELRALRGRRRFHPPDACGDPRSARRRVPRALRLRLLPGPRRAVRGRRLPPALYGRHG